MAKKQAQQKNTKTSKKTSSKAKSKDAVVAPIVRRARTASWVAILEAVVFTFFYLLQRLLPVNLWHCGPVAPASLLFAQRHSPAQNRSVRHLCAAQNALCCPRPIWGSLIQTCIMHFLYHLLNVVIQLYKLRLPRTIVTMQYHKLRFYIVLFNAGQTHSAGIPYDFFILLQRHDPMRRGGGDFKPAGV